MIVIDASAVLAIMFGEPDAALVVQALRDYPRAACIAPDLLVLEVANSVLMFRRRLPADRALSTDGAFAFCTTEVLAQRVLEQLSSLGISLEPSTDARNFTQLITLAESHRLTSYDAAYLDGQDQDVAGIRWADRVRGPGERDRVHVLVP